MQKSDVTTAGSRSGMQRRRLPRLLGVALLALAGAAAGAIGAANASGVGPRGDAQWRMGDPVPEWFPVAVPVLDSSSSATHMGRLLEAPAGKHGRVTVRDGHFYFADGTRARFWGTNLTFDAALPPVEKADAVAARLAKLGFNMVRLHHLDTLGAPRGIFDYASGKSTVLDEAALRRLDALVAALGRHGIYYDYNLHVGRRYFVADGLPAPLTRKQKFATNFVEELLRLQEEMSSRLLQRVNTVTGVRYIDDPALALIELTNESSMFSGLVSGAFDAGSPSALPAPYLARYQEQWNRWLRSRYASQQALAAAWGARGLLGDEDLAAGTVRAPSKRGLRRMNEQRLAASLRFLVDLQVAAHERLRDHLRRIGVQVPITGTQHYDIAPGLQAQARMDYVDTHGYWNSPRGQGRNARIVPGASMVANPGRHESGMRLGLASPIPRWTLSKVQGKPLTVSEWNHCWPDAHSYELIPLAAAYADYQDWDGMMHFAYAQSAEMLLAGDSFSNPFTTACSGVAAALMPVAALIYERGDLRADPTALVLHYDPEHLYDGVKQRIGSESRYWWGKQLPWEAGLVRRVERSFSPGRDQGSGGDLVREGPLQTTTGEITWTVEEAGRRGWVAIAAERVAGVVGGLSGATRQAGVLTTRVDVDGTIMAISLDDLPLTQSARILVAVAGSERNHGQVMEDGRIVELGGAPVEMRRISGAVRLQRAPTAPRLKAEALDLRGQPLAAITLGQSDGGGIELPLGQAPVVHYLLSNAGGG